MKQLLNKLYFLLVGPLYRRLSRDIVLHMQELKRAQLEYQDRFSSRVCDQLVAMSIAADAHSGQSLFNYTDEQIIHIVVNLINSSEDLVELSKSQQIPLRDLIDIYTRYGGMDAIAIRRLRESEKRNALLERALLSGSNANGSAAAQPVISPGIAADAAAAHR